MIYPLVQELAVNGIPVTVTRRVLKIACQPYYRWLTAPVTASDLVAAYRADAPFDAHRDDPEFGYQLLLEEAAANGQPMTARTAWAICAANRWWSAFGKPSRGKGARPGPPVHDDRVNRVFSAQEPNQLWLTDITKHRTAGGKLHLCAVKDVHSNWIAGYSISDRVKSRLAVTALNNAVARHHADGADVAGCIVHSNRGLQFRSRKFVHALNRHELSGSMGRVGAAGDNAAMESFFALLQNKLLDRRASCLVALGRMGLTDSEGTHRSWGLWPSRGAPYARFLVDCNSMRGCDQSTESRRRGRGLTKRFVGPLDMGEVGGRQFRSRLLAGATT
ncbi:Integrase core domain-containing protein [Geodermatophilus amargosae]|uniref:Integrase core domain-containing protein n=1 Tax=Geodermatophilus amargosae TaxID=1296565 RepID=A0A1I7CGJ7_9ACTN|nr:DDE-type integrase/transposase/recombinase [Geodermatophilus amargosae]SFT98541.1 Integrase core domain-containing protein [Geodermatophilus amargosae]